MAEVSEVSKLQAPPLLHCLVLAECPVSEVDDYRLEVLVALPKLERLDKDEFTEDERSDAEEVGRGGRGGRRGKVSGGLSLSLQVAQERKAAAAEAAAATADEQ